MSLDLRSFAVVWAEFLLFISTIRHRTDEQLCELLRKILRAIPYWQRGHIKLGEISYTLGDIQGAYASAQAGLQLSGSKGRQALLHSQLGRCYMRVGEMRQAGSEFERTIALAPKSWSVLEDWAASEMALENFEKALSLFQKIPENALSIEGRAALSFIQTKTPQTNLSSSSTNGKAT